MPKFVYPCRYKHQLLFIYCLSHQLVFGHSRRRGDESETSKKERYVGWPRYSAKVIVREMVRCMQQIGCFRDGTLYLLITYNDARCVRVHQ